VGIAIAVILAGALFASVSEGAEVVSLHTSMSPDRLGASTTIGFGFKIVNTTGGAPAPLQAIDLHLPKGIGYLSTTLGLATCEQAQLATRGPAACPPNSRLGFGSAYVEVPFGLTPAYETPGIQAFRGPSANENLVVLFYVDGQEPVFAQLVFDGELLAGSATLGGSLTAEVPLISSVPSGPPVSIVSVQTTVGPKDLTYYRRVHGKTIKFHPTGVSVPFRCPHGGFPFSANFSFIDGTTAAAASTVPCPRSR
jgi:hypothetical protein